MSNNYYDPNDATQPAFPQHYNQPGPSYPQRPANWGAGNTPDPRNQRNAARQPYQYPGPQIPPLQQRAQAPGTAYPYQQPGQNVGRSPFNTRRRRRGGCTPGCLVVLVALVVIGFLAFSALQHVLAFGERISTQAPLSTSTGYMNTADRTNLLIMGYGGGGHDGSYLTDSLVVVSLLPQSHHTSLVSVPRDLFVQYPPNSGRYMKINAIYQSASQGDKDSAAGGSAVMQKINLVTGMNVNYWLTIDFTGFKKVIDAIGGVDVGVPNSFNACYPKNDNANVDASWIKVQFNKGIQHMDGATAIEYARAREPLEVCGMGKSENLAELTDFGRSARQQLIIKAVLAKFKQVSTWPQLYAALDALQQTVHTNMSLADLAAFALKMDLNDPQAAHIGLSNQNVLQDSQSTDGQYILAPANGNWAAIPPYIQKHLYN